MFFLFSPLGFGANKPMGFGLSGAGAAQPGFGAQGLGSGMGMSGFGASMAGAPAMAGSGAGVMGNFGLQAPAGGFGKRLHVDQDRARLLCAC